jgi:hypothetical protein
MPASQKYILVNDPQLLGEFYLHYGSISDNPNNTCLRAVFKIDLLSKDQYNYVPGYKTYSQDFYPCPISALYTQINRLESRIDNEEKIVRANIVVFSKDYKNQKIIEITSKSQIYGSGTVSIMSLNPIINTLNNYISEDNNLELLDETIFNKKLNLSALDSNELLTTINNLDFKFYSNSLNRVGKDNYFWTEIEIINLPESKYLRLLFEQILSNGFDNVSYQDKERHIFLECGKETSYSPSHRRQETELNDIVVQRIKDFLKVNLYNYYNSNSEINERLKKKN